MTMASYIFTTLTFLGIFAMHQGIGLPDKRSRRTRLFTFLPAYSTPGHANVLLGVLDYPYFFGFYFSFSKYTRGDEVEAN